jgi:Brp/Blh family beta-carotene 15,15'-monooxygenase
MTNRFDRLPALATVPGVLGCASAAALAILAPGVAAMPAVQWMPWAVGLLVVGIPHGALDHRVGRAGEGGPTRVAFLAGYLALTAAVLAVWRWSPMAALVGFLVVAAFHFGQGDLYWSRASREGLGPGGELRDGPPAPGDRWRSALFLAVRGLVPVALPVLVFADAFRDSADAMAGRLFGDSARWGISEGARAAGLGLVAGLVALHLVALAAEAARRPDRRRLAMQEAGGTGLLVLLFSVAPPVLAMGVYFNAWHSVRHVARLLPAAGPTREAARSGRWGTAIARFQVAALPTTIAATLMIGGLWWALRDRAGGAADFGLAALAMVSALTLPHVLVVLGMDRAQSVWRRPRAAGVRP